MSKVTKLVVVLLICASGAFLLNDWIRNSNNVKYAAQTATEGKQRSSSATTTSGRVNAASKVTRALYGHDGPAVLPDPSVTPGDTLPVTAKEICVPGYSKRVRNVTQATKLAVYAEYQAVHKLPACCEVDHLISLELGGSNDIKNLWPQPYEPKPGAYQKDALENVEHSMVCAGKLSLTAAQQEIRTDWYKAYIKYGLDKP